MNKNNNYLYKYNALLLIFVFNLLAFFVSANVGLFDPALFRLQLAYPTVGLDPFKNFIIYYPDGLALLSKALYNFTSGTIKFEWLIWPIHLFLQILFFRKIEIFTFHDKSAKDAVLLILLIETCFYALLGTEPFSLLITSILLLEVYEIIHKNKNVGINFILLAFILSYIRWDRLIYSFITVLCFFIYLIMRRQNFELSQFYKVVLGLLLGFLIMILSLAIVHSDNFTFVFKTVFIEPLKIAQYRSLHYSIIKDLISFQTLKYCLILFYIYAFYKLSLKKFESKPIFLLFFGLSFLPYTISRPDIAHLFPYLFTTSIFIFLGFMKEGWLRTNRLVLLISAFSISALTLAISQHNETTNIMVEKCINITRKIDENPKTIFVGNTNYQNVVINFPLFYLRNLDLVPSTKYISDEPGVQNLCEVQKNIVSNIEQSEKPTIFYLNTSKIIDKNNFNNTESCKILENFFENHLTKISECEIGKYKVDVKIIR